MRQPVRVAVIGAGVFGLEHLDALSRSTQAETVAVCDINDDVANRAADLFRIPHVFSTVDDLLCAPGIDAVVVATPSKLHADTAVRCLAARKHVLLEKPVAMSTSELAQIRTAWRRHPELVLLPGHVLRHSRTHRRIRQAVRDGEVGSVLAFVASRDRERGHHERYSDISPTLLTMVHDIDLALWITEHAPATVAAQAATEPNHLQPSVVHAQVQTTEGSIWSLRASWALPSGAANEDLIDIFGSSGVIHYRSQPDFTLRREVESVVPFTGSDRIYDSDLDEEIDYFLTGVINGQQSTTAIDDAEVGLRVIEAIDRSLRANGRTTNV